MTGARLPEIICLWGRRRDSKSNAGATPSNTDKGIRELKAKGYKTIDVDAHAIAKWIPRRFSSQIANGIIFGIGAAKLWANGRNPERVVHTASSAWVRIAASLKRRKLLCNRLVIRWAGNDMDYSALAVAGPVRTRAFRMMEQVDACVFASLRQHRLWCEAFPNLAPRFLFWPTPVDVNFYLARRPNADISQNRRIVAVGSDAKRDWDLPLKMARAGVPITILTEDPKVPPLVDQAHLPDCQLLFRVGLDRSADVLAGAGAILLSTLENERFSGSTTIGVAAALERPLILDEPYDLSGYGLEDNINCVTFKRGDVEDAILRARAILSDGAERERLGRAIGQLANSLSIEAYVSILEEAFRPKLASSGSAMISD